MPDDPTVSPQVAWVEQPAQMARIRRLAAVLQRTGCRSDGREQQPGDMPAGRAAHSPPPDTEDTAAAGVPTLSREEDDDEPPPPEDVSPGVGEQGYEVFHAFRGSPRYQSPTNSPPKLGAGSPGGGGGGGGGGQNLGAQMAQADEPQAEEQPLPTALLAALPATEEPGPGRVPEPGAEPELGAGAEVEPEAEAEAKPEV